MRTEGKPEGNMDGLLSLEIIRAAVKGNANAMEVVLDFYDSAIYNKSVRKQRDHFGNVYYGPDDEIRDEIKARLMKAIVSFKE